MITPLAPSTIIPVVLVSSPDPLKVKPFRFTVKLSPPTLIPSPSHVISAVSSTSLLIVDPHKSLVCASMVDGWDVMVVSALKASKLAINKSLVCFRHIDMIMVEIYL
jgi:hypothetical protein